MSICGDRWVAYLRDVCATVLPDEEWLRYDVRARREMVAALVAEGATLAAIEDGQYEVPEKLWSAYRHLRSSIWERAYGVAFPVTSPRGST